VLDKRRTAAGHLAEIPRPGISTASP